MRKGLNVLAAVIALLPACTHQYYVASPQIITGFEKKGQVLAGGSIGSSGSAEITSMYGAWALGRNAAFTGNVLFADGESESGESGSGTQIELAVGSFRKISPAFRFEAYTGYALGTQRHKYIVDNGQMEFQLNYRMNHLKVFVQPSLSFREGIFETIFSGRLTYLEYWNESGWHEEYDAFRGPYLFMEPALTFRIDFKQVRLQVQYQDALPFPRTSLPVNTKGTAMLGLHLVF
jgi:hypothetical protein